jgi:hypothetical protein
VAALSWGIFYVLRLIAEMLAIVFYIIIDGVSKVVEGLTAFDIYLVLHITKEGFQ